MPTDTSERGLERLICTALAGHPCDPPLGPTVGEPSAGYGGVGWAGGNFHDYDREYCVDLAQLSAFLRATQPEASESLDLSEASPTRRRFLARLQGEITKRGTIDVLRHGIKHEAHNLDLFYGTPSADNPEAQERFKQNRFTVTRQLRYSRDETQRALDIGLFINGLPVFTFELKNSLTKQTVADAVLKQAIQEGFILDVLAHYMPVQSYYKLAKTVEEDPEFDVNKAQKKLRRFVESSDHAIGLKAQIMVDHFHDQVLAQNKIGGQARAMVVTNGIERAIQYYHAIRDYLQERKSRYRAIVAFSGEHEFGGEKVTEASLNGFPSAQIAGQFQEDPYRFLVCADKFQTGYDEPLLHTMYVDKTLSDIKAVQTLSRLNRAHPKKHDVFVLDFLNDTDTICDAFADYYRATILADETDPNKLHDLQTSLDRAQVYSDEQVDDFVSRYLDGAQLDQLDPILDACVASYKTDLDEDGQVEFKGNAKGFVRTYAFLWSVLPYNDVGWEKRSIFLNFLIPKLPTPKEEDRSKGILDAIDLDSYRVEKQVMQQILLPDEDAEVDPVPTTGGSHRTEPELDRLSNILKTFNDLFGDIAWEDADRVGELITKTIPSRVAADAAFKNARQNSDAANSRIEHDKALLRVMTNVMKDDTELFKQFMDNEGFKRWMTDRVFELACEQTSAP